MGIPSRKKCLHVIDNSFLENKITENIEFVCAECGSKEVEGKFWVELNTEKSDMTCWDLNENENSYWCKNCSQQVKIDEIKVKKRI